MAALPVIQASWKYLLIICLGVVIVYLQSVRFDFVNYDDPELVYENASYIGDVSNVFNAFTTHAFTTKRKESVYYRPVLLISYIVDYQIWKLNPAGYHITNILLHCIAAIIIFLLFESILNDKLLSLFGGLLFSLHPIQVESAAWIAGRNDVLLGLFVSLMIYFYVLHHNEPGRGKFYFTLTAACYSLALFTKESAAFFVLLLPAYDLTIRRASVRSLFHRSAMMKYFALAFMLGLYLLIRFSIFGEVVGAEKLYGRLSLPGRLYLIPALISENLSLLFFPFRLSVEHPLDNIIWLEPPWNIFAVIITASFIVTVWLAWKYRPALSFGLTWLFVGLIPVLNIFPVAVPILEHRLYAASVGFILSLICFLRFLSSRYSKRTVQGVSIILIAASAIMSFIRMPVWKNGESLWLDAIEKAPTASRSYFNLAGYYFERRQYDKTTGLLLKYIELKPEDFLGYSKLRQTYLINQQYDKSISVCRQMIAMDPKNQNRYLDLGLLFDKFNLTDSITSLYQEALSIDSTFYLIHDHLGTVYQKLNNVQQAEYHYQKALEIKPDYAQAYFHIGSLAASSGRNSEALKWIDQGMKFAPAPDDVVQLRSYLFDHLK